MAETAPKIMTSQKNITEAILYVKIKVEPSGDVLGYLSPEEKKTEDQMYVFDICQHTA